MSDFYKIGLTKNAKIIFQDFQSGNVRIKEKEDSEMGLDYPYADWVSKKDEIADIKTLGKQYSPAYPRDKPSEDLRLRTKEEKEAEAIIKKAEAESGGWMLGALVLLAIIFLLRGVMKVLVGEEEKK